MSSILLVPVYLDALVLDHDQMVVETTADFSRLPNGNDKYDIHPDIANISEELVAMPFQKENLLLRAGIHLHWSLPDAAVIEIDEYLVTSQASGKYQLALPRAPPRKDITTPSARAVPIAMEYGDARPFRHHQKAVGERSGPTRHDFRAQQKSGDHDHCLPPDCSGRATCQPCDWRSARQRTIKIVEFGKSIVGMLST